MVALLRLSCAVALSCAVTGHALCLLACLLLLLLLLLLLRKQDGKAPFFLKRPELGPRWTSELVCRPRLPAARLAPECPDPLGERITRSELGYKLTGEPR